MRGGEPPSVPHTPRPPLRAVRRGEAAEGFGCGPNRLIRWVGCGRSPASHPGSPLCRPLLVLRPCRADEALPPTGAPLDPPVGGRALISLCAVIRASLRRLPKWRQKKGKMESDEKERATAAPLPPPPEAPHGETPPRPHGAVDTPLPRPLPASRQTWLGLHATSPPPPSAYLSRLTSSGDAGTTSPPPKWPPPPPRNRPSDSTLSQDTAPPQTPSLARAHAGRSMHSLGRAGGQVADAGSGADGAAHTAEAARKHYRRRQQTRSRGAQ